MQDLDHRYLARDSGKWWESIDGRKNVVSVKITCGHECEECYGGCCEELIEFPFKYEVCPTCGGKGKHVNPNIDSHGLTRDDFEQDPDFAEDYFSGLYDVDCYECNGTRVVPVIEEEFLNEEQKVKLKFLQESRREDANYARMCAMERAMGC